MKAFYRQVSATGVLLVLLLSISSWATAADSRQSHAMRLVTSIKPLALIANDLLHGIADVESLVPAGVSPHDYALKPSDRLTLQQADLVIWLGPEMEQFLTRSLRSIDKERVLTIIESHDGVDQVESDHHHHEDPHIWLDPLQAIAIADKIRGKLCQLNGQQCDELKTRFAAIEAEYQALNQTLIQSLAPIRDKPFIAWHRGFDQFVAAFGLNQLAWVSENPEVQPGARHLLDISRLVKANPAMTCLWQEAGHKTPAAESFAARWQLKVVNLDILGGGKGINSYPDLMRRLVEQLQACR